jgi:hypothetical protein
MTVRRPPVNVLRVSLHPGGLAPRIANLAEWRAHLLARWRHQIDLTADAALVELLSELSAYQVTGPSRTRSPRPDQDYAGVVAPFQLLTDGGMLTLFSTTTIFGTPIDITLSELAIESFFPATCIYPSFQITNSILDKCLSVKRRCPLYYNCRIAPPGV